MQQETITVKVLENGSPVKSQSLWHRVFTKFCEDLVTSHRAQRARANVVFPGTDNPAMATIYTIEVEAPFGIDEPLRQLQAMPGVQFAHRASSRGPLPVAAR
ncbi:hypothetical protein QRD43_16035 [Pelomonas sp. APW6]|uniref:Uncharacterized protein n=1 Tax=Roseateles subflavus TaxID=3053353 RepID=A0ABT7LKN5_9BURK|nr:hypothetical protein [Pelomonas sp. APW6]MDL5033425.1 hypothetical protein [Pelomonas sp. APW6]